MFTSDPSHIKCHLLQLIERDCEMGAVKVFYLNLTAPANPGFTPHSPTLPFQSCFWPSLVVATQLRGRLISLIA